MPDPGPDPRHDAFIARQRAALKELGLPEAMLAREEALLRGGLAAGRVFAALLDRPEPGQGSGET
jgi:hypothetical protein